MNAVLVTLLAAAAGFGSAILPFINAEAYTLVAASRSHGFATVGVVLAMATGQTAGKVLLYASARKGAQRFEHKMKPGRWVERTRRCLQSPRTGVPIVIAAASVGLPPLAAVSLMAGAARFRWQLFVMLCLVGRIARFSVLVLPVAYVT